MLLTNHTLTGLALSAVVENPFALAPASFASHFAMDLLPHFGHDEHFEFGSRRWIILSTADNLIALSIFVAALALRPDRWVHTVVGVFFACLPDLLFIPELILGRPPIKWFRRFHSSLQWSHSYQGIIVEAAWAVVMVFAVTHL